MDALTERIIAEDHKHQAYSWKNKYDAAIEQLEINEALTKDPETVKRIRTYLTKEGIWESPQKN